MVNKKSLATFVRTVGNQVISGFKHFLNNVKIGGDLIIDPNSLGAPATNVLTVDGSGVVKTATAFSGISVDSVSKVKHEVKAGVAINKGQAVYVTGADGTNMIVGLASNATEATSSKTMGLLESTVAINGKTNVITEGLLAGLDTSMASAGDVVWLGTGGNLLYGLANKPYAPAHLVFIGIVTRSNSNNGEIFVKVQNGFELNEIHDVDLKTTVPVNGHILGFDGTLWVNKTIAGWLGYTPANAANESNWNAAYNDKINSAAVTGTTTKTLTLTQQDGGTITASWTDINTDAVTSVFGRTGAVVATSGDYTTAQVTESGNLYFTNARGIGSTLTGYASGAGVISSADTILSAIQKLNGNIGALVTGVSSVNGLSGAVTLTTTNIAEGTNLYYTEARVNANTNVAANTAARHNAVTIGTANGLSLSTQVLSLGLASASTNGALSSTDWTTFNSKQAALNGTGFVKITGTTISYDNSTYYLASNPNGYTSNVGTVTSITATAGTGISISGSPITTSGTLTITNTAPDQTVVLTSGAGISVTGTYPNFTITNSSPSSGGTVTSIATTAPITGGTITSTGTIGITQAGASTDGYLSSTDWNTFNNKQPALTNPITGTGTTNYLSKFTGSTTLGNSQIFDNGTSVGIGTATPAVELAIYQSTTPRLHLQNSTSGTASNKGFQVALSGTAGYLWNFQNGATIFATNNTERLRITADGNVGIGTTSPSALLHVAKSQTSDTAIMVSNLGTVGASTTLSFVLAESTTPQGWFRRYRDGSANTEIGFSNSLLFTGSVTGTKAERMRITDAGNVGIGTTSPTQKLDVVGTGATNVRIASDSTAETSLHFGNTTGGRVSVRSNAYLALDTNATERMRIDASGNVGIGTTTPAHKLSVVGSGTGIAHIGDAGFGSGNYVGASFNGTLSTTNYNILSSPTNPHLYLNRPAGKEIKFREDNTEQMTILSGGNVGIGTTLPAQKLDVAGTVRTTGTLGSSSGSYSIDHQGVNTWKIGITATNTSTFHIGNDTGGAFINKILNITSAGNVGIGTTTPNEKLTVAGKGYFNPSYPIVLTGKGSPEYGTNITLASDTGTTQGAVRMWSRYDGTGYAATTFERATTSQAYSSDPQLLTYSESMRISGAGNVGIGTTSPAASLHIGATGGVIFGPTAGAVGTSQITTTSAGSPVSTRFAFGTDGTGWQYRIAKNTAGTIVDLVTVADSGRVGIGTTSPDEKLHVAGNVNAYAAGGINAGLFASTSAGATTIALRSNGVTHLNGGNVGIGTTSPSYKLDVVGSGRFTDGNQSIRFLDSSGWATNFIKSDLTASAVAHIFGKANSTNNSATLRYYHASDGSASNYVGLGFYGNDDILRVLASGNVGIGTTAPAQKLDISQGSIFLSGSGSKYLYIRRYDGLGTHSFGVGSDEKLILSLSGSNPFIVNGGNVGIGTISPTQKLDVTDGDFVVKDSANVNKVTLTRFGGIELRGNGTGFRTVGTPNTDALAFATNNAERIRISSDGNVGIGTTSPSAKLHVIGNATVSATLSTVNAKISGTLADSFNQVGTAGQVLSSTGTGIEWVTGGGGGGGSTIIVKDEGTTIGSSFTTLDFIGDNVNATASGSTAVIEVSGRASSRSVYYDDIATPFVIPGSGFADVDINGQIVMTTVPSSLTGSNKLMATITFGVSNVSTSEAFNGFKFRLYNTAPMSDVQGTTHSWNGFMSKDEGCTTTVFTFHIPIEPGVVAAGDTIVVQADALTNYTPEIYYCALTLMEGTN